MFTEKRAKHYISFLFKKAADKFKTIGARTENTELICGPQKESSSRDPLLF
jgi:hypothetical protein